jgi:hypothetical protein
MTDLVDGFVRMPRDSSVSRRHRRPTRLQTGSWSCRRRAGRPAPDDEPGGLSLLVLTTTACVVLMLVTAVLANGEDRHSRFTDQPAAAPAGPPSGDTITPRRLGVGVPSIAAPRS